MNTYLGFDYGTKKIGVAIGNTLTCKARALTTIANKQTTLENDILKLINEWQPHSFIVGQPLQLDGKESKFSKKVAQFAIILEKKFQKPVIYIDERLTSEQAEVELREEYSRNKAIENRDSKAAELILQSYLNQFS